MHAAVAAETVCPPGHAARCELTTEQLQALVGRLPWQRLSEYSRISVLQHEIIVSASALEREDAKVDAFEASWQSKACLSATNLAQRYSLSSKDPEGRHE